MKPILLFDLKQARLQPPPFAMKIEATISIVLVLVCGTASSQNSHHPSVNAKPQVDDPSVISTSAVAQGSNQLGVKARAEPTAASSTATPGISSITSTQNSKEGAPDGFQPRLYAAVCGALAGALVAFLLNVLAPLIKRWRLTRGLRIY